MSDPVCPGAHLLATAGLFVLGALSSLPAAAVPTESGRLAAGAIADRIAAGDCAGAVDDLKAGLKRDFDEVTLMAGTMYDNGICVKRDWNRAIAFYAKAWEGGMKEAADRLAAGYAAPENGADVAAALWWASRGIGQGLQAHGIRTCAVSAAVVDDADRFVAELGAWQPARLTACNYMVGVMSTVAAEIKYPALAQRYGLGGSVILRFRPAAPRIDMEDSGLREFDPLSRDQGDMTRGRATRALAEFEKTVRDVSERALRRYPNPGGFAVDSLVTVEYRFEMH